jgi:hypothetical protein
MFSNIQNNQEKIVFCESKCKNVKVSFLKKILIGLSGA